MGFRIGKSSKPIKEDVKPVIKQIETLGTTVTENKISDIESESGRIYHKGFAKDDLKQDMVRYAYKLGGMDLVKTIECENGNRDIKAIGDQGHAYGLCQVNNKYHKISDLYKTTRQAQIEKCAELVKNRTPFYGPNRIIKGKKCYNYVSDRFYFE